MVEKSLKIANESGLHARPASIFTKEAQKFSSEVTLVVGEKEVNGKSIMGVLSCGIGKDQEVTIRTNGEDEKEALDALYDLVLNGLGE